MYICYVKYATTGRNVMKLAVFIHGRRWMNAADLISTDLSTIRPKCPLVHNNKNKNK